MTDKRGADVAAWIALVLSLGGAGWQIIQLTRGAVIEPIAPDSFALYAQSDAAGKPMVRIAAPASILNKAEPPYGSSAVVREWAVLQVGTLKSLQQWNAFGTIDRKKGISVVQSTGAVMPEGLPSSSATSAFVLFLTGQGKGKKCGQSRPCDSGTQELRPEELLAAAKAGSVMQLSIIVEDAEGHRYVASCSRVVDADATSELKVVAHPPPPPEPGSAPAAYLRCSPIR